MQKIEPDKYWNFISNGFKCILNGEIFNSFWSYVHFLANHMQFRKRGQQIYFAIIQVDLTFSYCLFVQFQFQFKTETVAMKWKTPFYFGWRSAQEQSYIIKSYLQIYDLIKKTFSTLKSFILLSNAVFVSSKQSYLV